MVPSTRRWMVGLVLGVLVTLGLGVGASLVLTVLPEVVGPDSSPSPTARRTTTPGVDEIRRISLSWRRRPGPERRIVDVVCLVPDLPTFLEAISAWDERHAFPILIE